MKFVAWIVAKVERDSTSELLQAMLRATSYRVDTRCNSPVACNVASNVSLCVRSFSATATPAIRSSLGKMRMS
jgi:hypothetical protein